MVYELTDAGRALEPVLLALGGWGARVPLREPWAHLSATSVLLFLRGSGRPAAEATVKLELDDRVFTVRARGGAVEVEPGAPVTADAGLRTDPATLNVLLHDPGALAPAVRSGTAVVTGDAAAIDVLMRGSSQI
jgi:hypothetical protein